MSISTPTPEFRAWLRATVRRAVRRQQRSERLAGSREYWRRFFTSWVVEDPDPHYSTLDHRDGLDSDTVRRDTTPARHRR